MDLSDSEGLPEPDQAKHLQTLPGRGWFPYLRAYGAEASFFDGTYTCPTVNRATDFEKYTP